MPTSTQLNSLPSLEYIFYVSRSIGVSYNKPEWGLAQRGH